MNLILGGGYAGLLCALKLRAAGEPVLLVNGSSEFVERTRLHQLAAGQALPRLSLPGDGGQQRSGLPVALPGRRADFGVLAGSDQRAHPAALHYAQSG
ncbi:MAG: FAD-binding protein [Candidatus Eremiobacteraeota bacterium]|nr:FAD-binding protein [Candidatus Eremiobacteraeota bacterium]MCW5866033.1 FAD-binding protein [Candidatus Eremiobacteraeota bacterium]